MRQKSCINLNSYSHIAENDITGQKGCYSSQHCHEQCIKRLPPVCIRDDILPDSGPSATSKEHTLVLLTNWKQIVVIAQKTGCYALQQQPQAIHKSVARQPAFMVHAQCNRLNEASLERHVVSFHSGQSANAQTHRLEMMNKKFWSVRA